ncbi:HNH endonuclease signature motif containing protein [Jidongwangia harbinensis]|uniref:HNH endonuclease signature motif containing protein n=1 Tax=Jidongwangia harbinensis TaxID=2878561 RepID=UPI001CD9FC51|nr:HNH endonuclease signature motif containing protein [Jidongwangia harbinensis]MCA2214923.1 HNH endonuclease [Jidongwangia harbinensis]
MQGELERLAGELGKHALAPLWSLTDAEIADTLHAAHRLQQIAAAVTLHVIRQADLRELHREDGFRTTATWLRTQLRLDPRTARDLVDHATTLDHRPHLDHALSTGAIDARHSEVIAAALRALPADTPADTTDRAEAILIDHARHLEPAPLGKAGHRILEHIAPEVAEEADRLALERQDDRAHRGRGLTLSAPWNGTVRITGRLGVEDAAIVHAALDPLCVPHHDDTRTPAQRRADALTDVCRLALRTGELPDNGGEPPQLAVTVELDPLTAALGRGLLDTGERVTPATVRRLACDAQVLPVVLGGPGQILDAGRARRLATGPLRRALAVRDRGCAFPGCDRPPRWCDAHHIRPWSDGGPTALDNLVLLCRHHHREIHRGDWAVHLADDRQPEFRPPARLDPRRHPRRNIFHRRT